MTSSQQNSDPNYTVSGMPRSNYRTEIPKSVTVSGPERFKYFRAPVHPSLTSLRPELVLSIEPPPAAAVIRPPTPKQQTQGTQTIYREQDVQTDPFTPDYIVAAGTEPELLTLASLKWGRGLPASLEEVELIERARERRAFEAQLPDIAEDPETWKFMMEQQQLKEMQRREEQIEKLQADRLELIRLALEKADAETQYVNYQRIQALQEKWLERRDQSLKRVQLLRIKAIRKLTKARNATLAQRGTRKRDIINEYAHFASKVYAPMTRLGLRIDRDSHKFETNFRDNLKLHDIIQLEQSIPASMTRARITKPKIGKYTSAGGARKAAQMVSHLDKMEEVLKKAKSKVKSEDDDLAAYRKAPVVVRPPTPRLPFSQEDDSLRRAVIFLQKLMRGRSIQNAMFEGKERRLELIKELRVVETMEDDRSIARREYQEALQEHKKEVLKGHVSHQIGSIIGKTLDYLSKELVRYKEERRIAAMVMVAERERRMREAEEAGTRAQELERRQKQDEVFRQIMKVHSGTVDTYLEQVVAETISNVSRDQAMREAKQKAEYVNAIVDSLEQKANEPGEIVKELVSSFLLPGVLREDVKAKVSSDQKAFILAAHKIIYEQTGSKVIDMVKEHQQQESQQQAAK